MKIVTHFFILLLSLFLVGCSTVSTFNNRDKQYLQARSIPPLKTPPGISSGSFQSYYPVSDKQYPVAVEDVSLVPPGLMDK